MINFNSYLWLVATELSNTGLHKAGGLCLSLHVRGSTRGHVCVLAVCTCVREGMRGDTRAGQGCGGDRAPPCRPACVTSVGARLRFQCARRAGGEGDKGAIVLHSKVKPSSLLTSQLPKYSCAELLPETCCLHAWRHRGPFRLLLHGLAFAFR